MLVSDEVAADSAEIDSSEEVFQIEVQHVSPPAMNNGIRQDRVFFPKAMRQALLNAQRRLDLVLALLKKVCKLSLCKLQLRNWRVDGALTTRSLGDIERTVSRLGAPGHVSQSFWMEAD